MSAWQTEVLAVHAQCSPEDRERMAAHHAALLRAKRRQEHWIAVGNVTMAVLFWAVIATVAWRPWH